jgi:hypothetical protein
MLTRFSNLFAYFTNKYTISFLNKNDYKVWKNAC